MSIQPNYLSPITTGDTSAAVVYRLTDSAGRVWRSAPQILVNALILNETPSVNASGQWLIIPTLRHLMEGTTAQIEIYLQRTDLSLFRVVANDPTVDYLEVSPNAFYVSSTGVMPSIASALEQAPIGETLYTTGGAIPADPPPQAECAWVWRNRAFVAFGNDVYPSQEFATGLGPLWSSYFRITWNEGTGDIKGGGFIDWNYNALFKQDAIGIISGPGPDGLGHGNYIVQTLSTKAGCTNPRSIVNGADGCYYQDSQTNRLMLLGPNLQVQEAAPGAFDTFEAGIQIVDALHVEAKRQVWFATSTGIIVLDYKHRTASSPLGSVYTWTYPNIVGLTIVAGEPAFMLSNGDTVVAVGGQFFDLASDGTSKTSVCQAWETGELQPLGSQRMFNLTRLGILGEYVDKHKLAVTVLPNFATSGDTALQDITASPEQFIIRPPACIRISSARVRIEESPHIDGVGSPPVPTPAHTAGLKLIGFALELQDHAKVQFADVERIF